MTVTKEALVDLETKYSKVVKYIEEGHKTDTENESLRHSIKEMLIGMKGSLENLIRTTPQESKELIKLTAMLGAVYLYMGMFSMNIENENVATSEINLIKCLETIEKYMDQPEVILVAINMYNQLGILWSQHDPIKAKSLLQNAETKYKETKELQITPVDISHLFCSSQDEESKRELALKNLEKVHTLTLYYQAQIYGILKDILKSSVYCHNTLRRQLDSGDYEPIDWALNSATMSQFFMEQNGFKQARHHLAASSFILDKYEKELAETAVKNEAYEAKLENFKHRSADVARCWFKYHLLLLSKSRERLLESTEDVDAKIPLVSDLAKIELDQDSTVSKDDLMNLTFPSLDLSDYESQVTDQFVLVLSEAREVFLSSKVWYEKAISYYTLLTLASDYVEILQDQSQIYANLLFFYDSRDDQAKLHKRRADLLEEVVKEISPQYYLNYCRQIWYELAQIYSEILEIKIEKLREIDHPSVHAMTKVNSLITKSIEHYKKFIESFGDNSSTKRVEGDFEKPFLQAHFHVAALYGKYITPKNAQIKNNKESLEYYSTILEYCNAHSAAKEMIPAEVGICKEMSVLLPVKIAKLEHELA